MGCAGVAVAVAIMLFTTVQTADAMEPADSLVSDVLDTFTVWNTD